MERNTAVDHKLIYPDIPPIMYTVIGVVGHDLDMRIHQIAVLGSQIRSEVMGIDDDVRLDFLQHLEVNTLGFFIEG